MQLIGQYDSPFVRRVGLALTRYGMAFTHHPFSSFGESDKFVAHNPLRRVPTLVLDDGEALIDSYAILDHLDEVHGRDRALIAASGPERRAALRRCALATGVADKAVSFFYAKIFAATLDPAFVARSEAQIQDGIAALNDACADRAGDWWFGAEPGHDDNTVACVARFVSEAYAHLVTLADYPALADHCARAEARSEFQAIQQTFIPPA
ncbi:glutathione S-transferase family protein [Novosphingobium sp. JCM 18896]|uniref:glutathione S-transferase family protein n=1 Tax=Novosphingobium sp. JCM 18896 TaxID=2989731 RepID=UPI0022237ED1|nr:glutathione S-transferase family protein [Novosphingobium sp. JCM 18896]MCW1427758.1 glutathione S-transferase family protein [Novosphingobium sp. JCM 18896]